MLKASFEEEIPEKFTRRIAFDALLENKIETTEERIVRYKAVTKQEIIDMANKLLNIKKMGFVLLGPVDDATKKKLNKLLK